MHLAGNRDGTAVLGLGHVGALAGKPVMEGKGVLFKRFADADVFDLEVDSLDPEEVIRFCQMLEPTVGGINLEDIKQQRSSRASALPQVPIVTEVHTQRGVQGDQAGVAQPQVSSGSVS